MGWYEDCTKAIQETKGKMCSQSHCDEVMTTHVGHEYCHDKNQGMPIPSTECKNKKTGKVITFSDLSPEDQAAIQKDPSQYVTIMTNNCVSLIMKSPDPKNPDWVLNGCSCCCSCFASDTPIAIPGGTKAIQYIEKGEPVLVAKQEVQNGRMSLSWYSKEVATSSGAGGGDTQSNIMLYILYGDHQELIATTDQLFLMPDGKLKQADKLVPGKDLLVDADGNKLEILEIRLGHYKDSVHHIATGMEFNGTIDGHMLNANGVVVGDYLLQIYKDKLLESGLLTEDHDKLPMLGTAEYEEQNSTLKLHSLGFGITGQNTGRKLPSVFRAIMHESTAFPANVQAYFTEEEELELDAKAEKECISSNYKAFFINYLFKVYNAFYPDVILYLDWKNIHPNAYSFEEYGKKIVVISGGLARIKDLGHQGLAMIIASQIGRFYGGEPLNDEGFTSVGAADYYGVGIIMRNAFFLTWFDMVSEGIDQLRMLNGYMADIKVGEDGENFDEIPFQCRILSMYQAMAGGKLPTCAGGPCENGLKLEHLMVRQGSNTTPVIEITFNRSVSKAALKLENYTLSPETEIFEAAISSDNPKKVTLIAKLSPATGYTLSLSGITAEDGSTLDPNNSSRSFTTK